jgi:hypothetical protein
MEQPNSPESAQTANSSQQVLHPKKSRNLLFIFMLIGMCLFSLILIPRIPGLFTTWTKLPPSPVTPEQLLGTTSFWGGPGKVFVQTQGDQVYSFNMSSNSWAIAPTDFDLESSACNLSTLKFSTWKRYFAQPFQCAQIYGHGDVAPAPLFTFVLDQDGNLWYWAQESTLMILCTLPLLAGIGLVVGVFLYLAWLAFRRIRLILTRA